MCTPMLMRADKCGEKLPHGAPGIAGICICHRQIPRLAGRGTFHLALGL